MQTSLANMREMFVGLDCETPVIGGTSRRFINLDNAATTPPMRCVLDHINECAQWYASVHRGAGFKSAVSTCALDCCRKTIGEFVGIDPSYHTVFFTGYATDAINRLCRRLPFEPGDVVLASALEHHSNILPWRFREDVELDYVRADLPGGALDLNHLEELLRKHNGKARLVAVTGASNVTGSCPPLGTIAKLAHEHGARILVDASQLIAHRPVTMAPGGEAERIDFLAFSGHKMYAPFGAGCLIGPTEVFEDGVPALVGGGAVDLVTFDDVVWLRPPESEEAGTPNLLGICAMAKAVETLKSTGMGNIQNHERKLTAKALERLSRVHGIDLFGETAHASVSDRIGVIPFQSRAHDHALLAAALGYEWGIGVRNGCFCAQPYVGHLLQLAPAEFRRIADESKQGRHGHRPGFVRISLGLYNTEEDIDVLIEALEAIGRDGPRGSYRFLDETGEYEPEGFAYDFKPYLPGNGRKIGFS